MEQMEKRRLNMIVNDSLGALHIVVAPHRPSVPVLSNRMGEILNQGKTGFMVSQMTYSGRIFTKLKNGTRRINKQIQADCIHVLSEQGSENLRSSIRGCDKSNLVTLNIIPKFCDNELKHFRISNHCFNVISSKRQ